MPSAKPGSSLTRRRDSSRGHPQQSCAQGHPGTNRGATLASLPESLKGAPLPLTNFGGGFPEVSISFQRAHPTQPLQNTLLGSWVKSSEEMSSGGTPFSVCLSQGTHLKESEMAKSLTWDRQGKKVTGVPNLRSSSPFRPQSVGHGATPQAVVEAPAPPHHSTPLVRTSWREQ